MLTAKNFCPVWGCRKEQLWPVREAVGLLCLLLFYLHAQDWKCTFLTLFSARNRSMLVGITHYFSSYVPSFRSWTKPAALYVHGSVQTWVWVPVQSAVPVLCSKWLSALQERKMGTALPWWTGVDPASLTAAPSSTTFHDKRLQLARGSGHYQNQTQNHEFSGGLGINACSSDQYCRD